MKNLIRTNIVFVIIFMVLLPVSTLAQTYLTTSKENSDTLIVAANSPGDSSMFDRVRYNPSIIYSGPYKSNTLYYHYSGDPNWHVGSKKELTGLLCRPALESFRSTGTWVGHLNSDGSCADPSEGADWATGNKLNFDKSK